MKYKIKTLLVTLMITLTALLLVPEEIQSINDPPGADCDIGLDLSYVYNLTENLSHIIYDYPNGTLAKGRMFGSWGEHEAADMIAYWMEDIGLWDPTLETYPNKSYIEKIEDTSELFKWKPSWYDIDDFVVINNMSLKICNTTSGVNETVVDFSMVPDWNESILDTLSIMGKLNITNYNESLLTHEFVFENLSIFPFEKSLTIFESYLNTTLDNHLDEIIANQSVTNLSTLFDSVLNFLEADYNFTIEDLDANPDNVTNLPWFNWTIENNTNNDYVYFGLTDSFNPNDAFSWKDFEFDEDQRNDFINKGIIRPLFKGGLIKLFWNWDDNRPDKNGPKALVLYDFNKNTYDMNPGLGSAIPTITINNSLGENISKDMDNFSLNFTLDQSWNDSVLSYNVIGQINGTNTEETVILGCLYDSHWNQGTADAATGIGIMLSIAKYIQFLVDDSNGDIRPRCNLKFVAFGGEEYGVRGAYAYEYNHRDENIVAYIDLNQLGYLQDNPRQALYIVCNRVFDVALMDVLGGYSNFEERVNDDVDFKTVICRPGMGLLAFDNDENLIWNPTSDNEPFNRASLAVVKNKLIGTGRNVDTYCFIKENSTDPGHGWKLHHRSGLNHTEGDSMKYYDHNEVNVTTEMIWNATKYMVIDPDCWFHEIDYDHLDSNADGDDDYVEISFHVKPTIPHDRVSVWAILRSDKLPLIASYMTKKDYIVTSDGVSDTLTIHPPKWAPRGGYSLDIHLYNSTGDTLIESIDDVCQLAIGGLEDIHELDLDVLQKIAAFLNATIIKRYFEFTENQNVIIDRIYDFFVKIICQYSADPAHFVNIMDFLADNTVLDYFFVDSVQEYDDFNLIPCNHKPEKPQITEWPESLESMEPGLFTATTTDSDGDSIYYQWKWETKHTGTLYTPWILGGPYPSGSDCNQELVWLFPRGTSYKVWVRAKDRLLSTDPSDWSDPKTVTVSQGTSSYSGSSPFGVVSSGVVVLNQDVSCTGISPTVAISPQTRGELSFNWDLGDGNSSNDENVVHNYTQVGNYTVNLTVTDDDEDTYNHISNVQVVALKSEFDYTINTSGNSNLVCFEDISDGLYNVVNWSWDLDDGNVSFNQTVNHNYSSPGMYNITLNVTDDQTNRHSYQQMVHIETVKPGLSNITQSAYTVGTNTNITVNASAFDVDSGLDKLLLNISYPDSTFKDFEMVIDDDSPGDYSYTFGDTWQSGVYYISVEAYDNASNMNSSSGYYFNVSTQATISVCTLENEYKTNKYINLTDPPGCLNSIGYELLDDDSVLHIWNKYDSYYFNTSSGIQLTNHYDEYWSHNVLMLGYYNNDEWNLMYRTDELSGFTKDIDTDNKTYINITLWKDLSYSGYDFRLAIRYYLGSEDNELTVIPYIKNIDDEDISYTLGFAWELNDIQIDMTEENDYIEINGTSYYLNDTLDLTYTNMTRPIYCWDNSTNETYICDYEPIPYFYIKEDFTDNISESLYLRWDESLDYKVKVKSRTGEYNAPVTLAVKIGTLNVGQEKYTKMFWHDASEIVYYFDSYDNGASGEKWATFPQRMADGNENNYASTNIDSDVELLDGNTCTGTDLGSISKVELRCKGYYSGFSLGNIRDIVLRPVFSGEDGDNHLFTVNPTATWSSWYDITNDTNKPTSWYWSNVSGLECDVESDLSTGLTLHSSKVEVRVTYTPHIPMISNPYPADESINISIQPTLNITVNHKMGSLMNITWLSNSSGSWSSFGTNNSVGNGTYSKVFSAVNVNGQWWYWKVNVSDGTNYNISNVFKFYTGVQSKIKNTGSTNISGYLLIQIHFNDTELGWVVADDTVNESSSRWLLPGQQLGLDTIFNGEVNVNDLSSYGTGLYRIYAAFRDPYGNVLVTDDDVELMATYEFDIKFT